MTRGQLLKPFQRARAALLPGYREGERRECQKHLLGAA